MPAQSAAGPRSLDYLHPRCPPSVRLSNHRQRHVDHGISNFRRSARLPCPGTAAGPWRASGAFRLREGAKVVQRRLRVALLATVVEFGGIERVLLTLLKHMRVDIE